MDYSKMNESVLLRTIVEEELSSYEARFGKAVCPQANKIYNRKRAKSVIYILIAMILMITLIRKYGVASSLACIFWFGLFLVLWKADSIKKTFQVWKNPVVFYVSELAKVNPDEKIKDIIFTVCENTSAGTNSYGMGGYDDYDQYNYGRKVALADIETPAQRLKRRVIGIGVCVILVTGLLGFAYCYMIPHVSYTRVEDGYMLQSFRLGFSLEGKAVIPGSYQGSPVVAIDGGAFRGDPFIKTVELPDSISRIGGEAFKNCRNLERIRIPDKVTELRGNTFEGCVSLRNVELPDSIIEIHGECFVNCKKLQEINLPPSITEIKGNTFEGCSSLYSVVIPEGVTRIGGHAFYGCSSLKYVKVPASVESIGSSAFRKCDSLYSIELPEGISINERAFKESPTSITYYEHEIK